MSLHDLRHAVRTLASRPGFTGAALLSLVLGIGANTAIFSVYNAVFLRRLPFPDAERLAVVRLDLVQDGGERRENPHWTYPHLRAFRSLTRSFEDIAAFVLHDHESSSALLLTDRDVPIRVRGEYVSSNYFGLLGVGPRLGRVFTADEESDAGVADVALLSDALWRGEFGGDPAIVGRTLELNNRSLTIIGVLPAGFEGLTGEVDLWMPLGASPAFLGEGYLSTQTYFWLRAVAKTPAGLGPADISAALAVEGEALGEALPAPGYRFVPSATGLRAALIDPGIRQPLTLLLGAVSFVFLIACLNVINLLLSRSSARRKEVATRMALGAGPGRLFRQFLAEGAVLGVAGGVLGLLAALWGVDLLQAWLPAESGTWTRYAQALQSTRISVDFRVLGFTSLLALAAIVAFAVVPAILVSCTDLRGVLAGAARMGDYGSPQRKLNARTALVVTQVAGAILLTIAAGLMVDTLWNMRATDPGFDADGMLVLQPLAAPERSSEEMKGFYLSLLERLSSTPGVVSATLGTSIPLRGSRYGTYVALDGLDAARTDYSARRRVRLHVVDSGWARTLGIQLLEGREFDESDGPGRPQVVLVNRTAASSFWPGESALGKRVGLGMGPDDDWAEVVGVLADVSYRGVDQPVGPEFYLSYRQASPAAMHVFVRTAGDPAATLPAIRRTARELDPRTPIYGVRTMRAIAAQSRISTRFVTLLLGAFAGVALALAATGIYGVVAFSVARRRRELGIRAALGATAGTLLRFVLAEGVALTGAGVALGLAAAAGLTRLLSSQLYEVDPLDPWTVGWTVLAMALIGVLASLVPALRAARAKPMAVLREP